MSPVGLGKGTKGFNKRTVRKQNSIFCFLKKQTIDKISFVLQVREQERNIALQIRQDVKLRRDEQLHQLAEELKAEWQKAQDEKIKALEKLYLSGLRAVGEGHQQAKENVGKWLMLCCHTVSAVWRYLLGGGESDRQ